MTDFATLLEAFFYKYLSVERGCSTNTVANYKDTFVSLLNYLAEERKLSPSKVKMEAINSDLINSFLNWLETEKGIAVSTRNNRLAGIKSFFRYVSLHEPAYLNRCSSILAIKAKKTESIPMNYLTIAAWECLLKSFNLNDLEDLRDFCIIATLYESGARVSELIIILCSEVRFETPATMILHGKGKKTRIVPIDPAISHQLKRYLKMRKMKTSEYLFTNIRGEPLTRRGVDYILQKHFSRAKAINSTLFPDKISPHCIRHSRAMHLLENNVNLIYIRDLLGHSSVTTTEIYSKANPELKRKHIEEATKHIIDHEDYDDNKQDELLTWLRENF